MDLDDDRQAIDAAAEILNFVTPCPMMVGCMKVGMSRRLTVTFVAADLAAARSPWEKRREFDDWQTPTVRFAAAATGAGGAPSARVGAAGVCSLGADSVDGDGLDGHLRQRLGVEIEDGVRGATHGLGKPAGANRRQ